MTDDVHMKPLVEEQQGACRSRSGRKTAGRPVGKVGGLEILYGCLAGWRDG